MIDSRRSVGIAVLATGRYLDFVQNLATSARMRVSGLVSVFVLSDRQPPLVDGLDVRWLPWGHTRWPYSTMSRYRALTAYAGILSSVDVLIHIDADMTVVGEVDVRSVSGIFAVQHPGFANRDSGTFPYERREESRAYVPMGVGTVYVTGSVQGGASSLYLAACSEMADWIQDDLERGIIPLWHDESMLNRYCIDHPPDLLLPRTYCIPESRVTEETRIVALSKDHDWYREVPLRVRLPKILRNYARATPYWLRRLVRRT